MMRSNLGNLGAKQWGTFVNTFSAAGSQAGTVALSNGQTGKPVVIRASGNVSGQVSLTYGNGSQVIIPVNPNAPYTEEKVPASGFPNPTNAVAVTLTADGAGTIRCLVGFN
jgi:hypothetical protein